jgi:hypothetical protein
MGIVGERSLGTRTDEVIEWAATSVHGTFRTCCRSRPMSVVGGRADLARTRPSVPGSRAVEAAQGQNDGMTLCRRPARE